MIIAIDGPAAAGKGTLAKALAQHFGFHYLDTGSLYRRVALALLQEGKQADDVQAATLIAETLEQRPFHDADLRKADVGQTASRIAVLPEVRQALLLMQRQFAQTPPGSVLDGRDIGTIICPNADIKFFVTASPEVRSQRRLAELLAQGATTDYPSVLQEVLERDARDAAREIAPLKPAADAILLDTTEQSVASVLQQTIALVQRRQAR